jgi:predicted transcriptional regulator
MQRSAGDAAKWPNDVNFRRIAATRVRGHQFSPMRSLYRKPARSPVRLTLKGRHQKDAAQAPRTGGAALGPLETRLLELIWAQRRPATVGHVQRAFPELAYTTIMTTLDRLYRKGLLLRAKDGRAFTYAPRCTRDELLSELISGHVADLLGAADEGTVLLSTLVRAVGRTNAALLDELDALVQAERLRLRARRK